MRKQVPNGYFSSYITKENNKRQKAREKSRRERDEKLEELGIKRTENGLICMNCDTFLESIGNEGIYAMECPNCRGEWFENQK